MSKKIFVLLISLGLLFTACSSKNVYKKDTTSIYTFLQNKEGTLYVFIDDKYTYIINNPKSVKELKLLFKVTKLIKSWKFSHIPTIGLKNNIATINLNVDIDAKKQNMPLIKKQHFKKYKNNPQMIHKTFVLKAKYLETTQYLKKNYLKQTLKKPLRVKRINFNQGKTETNISGAGAGAIAIVGLPLILAGGLLITPFTGVFPD